MIAISSILRQFIVDFCEEEIFLNYEVILCTHKNV